MLVSVAYFRIFQEETIQDGSDTILEYEFVGSEFVHFCAFFFIVQVCLQLQCKFDSKDSPCVSIAELATLMCVVAVQLQMNRKNQALGQQHAEFM